MRAVALIAALACATAAHADGVRESRYGPAPDRPPVPLNGQGPGYTGASYSGQMLGWGGKREIVAPEVQAQPVQQPWWAQQQPQVAPQPQPAQRYVPQAQYQPQPQYQQQAPAPQPQQAYAPAPRQLPQSIYDAPQVAPPAPTQVAYATPVPQQEPQARTLQPGQVGARTYSVGRQFGLTPDPIPAAGPPRMVLISAPPASAPDDEKPREDDDRDWQAKSKKDSDQ